MLNTANYLVYLALSAFVTVYVSRTLSRNGLPFLVKAFNGDRELAGSINHLLVVGFYLVNLGFVLLRMNTQATVDNFEQLIVYQASGLGLVLLVLGGAHFFNMYVIHQLGRSAAALFQTAPSPAPPARDGSSSAVAGSREGQAHG